MGDDATKKAAAKKAAAPSGDEPTRISPPETGESVSEPTGELSEQFIAVVKGGPKRVAHPCATYDDAVLAGLSALKDGEGDRFSINKVYVLT